jgi:TPR repeat protein
MYENGFGTAKDKAKALELFHKAADHGDLKAQAKLKEWNCILQ